MLERIDGTYELWKQSSVNRLEYYFDDMKSAIQKRNKSIRIADKAEAGWKAVNEYMPDDLTENSGNIKKLEATKESHKRQ